MSSRPMHDSSSSGAWRRRLVGVAGAGTVCLATAGVALAATPPAPASAIGDATVSSILVSPAYAQTGVVLAVANAHGCSSSCTQIWVSRDRGDTWQRAAARGWQTGRIVIGVDGRGREVLVSGNASGLQRSGDLGTTWTTYGTPGAPSLAPSFATDGTVAVADGRTDHLVSGGSVQPVAGSGGTLFDTTFMYAPSFPSGGRYSPALLAGETSNPNTTVVARCSAALSCTGAAVLAGSGEMSGPAALLPSTDYADDGVVFAQLATGIYKSSDGGLSFTPIHLGDPSATATATQEMALAPGYSEHGPVHTAYAAVWQIVGTGTSTHSEGGIYRSEDAGTTWSRYGSPGPFDGSATAVAVTPDQRVLGGYFDIKTGHAGLLCSKGAAWQASCDGPRSASVATRAAGCTTAACGQATAAAQPGQAQAGGSDQAATGGTEANAGDPLGGSGLLASGRPAPSPSPPWRLPLLALGAVLAIAAAASAVVRRRRSA